MSEQRININGIELFPFNSDEELLDHLMRYKGILFGVNADVVLNASKETRQLINRHTGFSTDYITAFAVRNKGKIFRNAKLFNISELWLFLIHKMYLKRESIFIITDDKDNFKQLELKLKCDFLGVKLTVFYLSTLDYNNRKLINIIIEQSNPQLILANIGGEIKNIFMEELFQTQPVIYMGILCEFAEYVNSKFAIIDLDFKSMVKSKILKLKYFWLVTTNRI